MKYVLAPRLTLALGILLTLAPSAHATTRCHMTFHLDSWSVFYTAGHGGGSVWCDNGQKATVALHTTGGGVTFGRSKIVGGSGEFSPVADIDEIFGHYANAEVHAGMGASSAAHVLTKGTVSLALSGTGNGVDLGFAFGRFTIAPAAPRHRRAPRPPPTAPEDGY